MLLVPLSALQLAGSPDHQLQSLHSISLRRAHGIPVIRLFLTSFGHIVGFALPKQPLIGGRRPHSFSIEFSPKFSPILAKILVI